MTTIETVRETLHTAARSLYDDRGKCANATSSGWTCIQRQTNQPLAQWDNASLCERCAAAWHTLMAATLIDVVLVNERFADFVVKPVLVPPSDILLANFAKLWDTQIVNAVASISSKADSGDDADDTEASVVEYNADENDAAEARSLFAYTVDNFGQVVEHGTKSKKAKKKAAKAPAKAATKAPAKKVSKKASKAEGPFVCKHCSKEFEQSNWKTMHERFCKE